jgi:hypothetical protein
MRSEEELFIIVNKLDEYIKERSKEEKCRKYG